LCRRLLFVGMTRAQTQLYLCHSSGRQVGGESDQENDIHPPPHSFILSDEMKERILSEFISIPSRKKPGMFSLESPQITSALRADVANVLGRELVDEKTVEEVIEELYVVTKSLNCYRN
jgi:ATP-dependent exoDNAse (exonuclease V) beta subunit